MPLYEYRAVEGGCDYCKSGFEHLEKFDSEPLKTCPKCGAKVQRIISSFYHNKSKSTKELLSDKNLAKHGFTKLVNEGGGKFRITN